MRIELFGKTILRTGADAVAASPTAVASSDVAYYPNYNRVYAVRFDGEKNLGELGPIRKYVVDHDSLRLRAWQLFLESEICQTVFKRFGTWVIGEGLKLQAEPKTTVLLSEGIEMDPEEFNTAVEERFKIYCDSTIADYRGMNTLHELADEAFLNSKMGDVLVVCRLIGGAVKVELKDGAHVCTPPNFSMVGIEYLAPNGNRVRNGIEEDGTGQHVAFYVKTAAFEYERIPARGPKSGELMAWMVYGMTYRRDNNRGIPIITAVMETAKKMERYKEATVGSAEERQKIAFTIEHDATSTGESPLMKSMAKAAGFTPGDDLPADVNGVQLANTVAATTNKQTFNMPIGAKMTQLASTNELQFKDFYGCNIDIVCATVGIPPNVAMSKYDSNFSASRAALKDWEHTLAVERKRFANQFYQKIYNLWLTVQVHTNKIAAPGYLTAVGTNNSMAVNAYRSARWVGATVPHIDPVKEVQAERLKLGGLAANMPLTTQEAATEALNGGDAKSNTAQFATEIDRTDSLGITRPAKETIPDPDSPEEEQ